MQSAQLGSLEQLSSIIESHRPSVYLLTFVLCAIFSYAMLSSYRRAKSEKWMKYFGVAAGILTVQYLVLLVSWYAGEHTKAPPVRYDAYSVVTFFLQLLSTANNVWFLATARELKNKKPAFPRWCWLLAGGALLATVAGNLFMIQDDWLSIFVARSLDNAFSAFCLVLLGHAIYFNISFRIRRRSAFLARFAATIYAFVHIAYWFSPVIASLSSKESFKTEMMSFDLLLIAVSLPLKISLFIPAYLLLLRFVETLQDLAKLQDKVIDARQDYLSSDGVVQSISEKLGGDVDLTILLPGERNRRIASIPWPNKDPEKRVKVSDWVVCDPLIHESLLGSKELTKPESKGGPFVVIEPIEAHGTAIGCLRVSRRDYPFSQMAVRQIRAIANLVSPAVQSYRELAALDLLSIRFAEEQSEENTLSPRDAAEMIAGILHDAFSPVVTRLHLNFGFETIEPIYLGENGVAQSIKENIDWAEWNQVPLDFNYKDRTYFKLFKKRLTAKNKDTTEITTRPENDKSTIGNVVFAVTKTGDDRGHPALGTNYLHRKTAATLAADAYLDFARDYFGSLMKKFGVKLSRRTMSVEEWFEPVGEIAEEAGFSWVIANGSLKKRLGEFDYVMLDRILEELRYTRESSVVHDENGVNIKVYPLSNPLANARFVIELNLPSSEKSICLGVERSGFREELSFASPWKNFLLDFAKIADAALTRVTYAIELQRKQIESAHYQGLATATATSGTIIHQLSNLAHGQSASASALLDALAVGRLTASEEIQDLMYSIKRSSDRMKTFLSAITNFTRKDERRPSDLLEAVRQAGNFFEASLLQRKINLRIAVDKDTMLDVPFSIATLAIANLIGNAKDAMPKGGEIRIEAETNGDMVLCRVIDEGRGIPTHIRDKIFDLGFSTKNGEGTGWGLYLTKHSLQENRSKIELTETNDKGSAFTIHFPRPK
jgi:signal transduction histidine kinase